MNIGQFKYDKKADTYKGDIQLLTTQGFNVEFVPNKKASDKQPDYRVTFQRIENQTVEIGSAWKRQSDKGKAFLSVNLDDPVWPAPLNAALFPSEDGKTATLVWTRTKRKQDKRDDA
ncbi:DUF736 domain-containing protein [Bradyrhizobium sp. CCGUVB14]|uniref:DUF736 domain-containing protein n=1 Tax=Bradyrhizobium sp. CCGUVB14 TaxID=2949628 RepID=UPI0020B30AFD|nr:DUF736 domain-containing protein [Bradyrhizobium sp. CCGUVB14]MCP3439798.1 DUF736 domain-containing protein [Bradyrhizobium sp. CCGUVB14]